MTGRGPRRPRASSSRSRSRPLRAPAPRLAAVTPILPDETYYWEWSRRLAGGYFDHPPMIALLIRAGTAVFGVSAFGIRVVPVLAGFGAVLAAIALARRIGGDDAALARVGRARLPAARGRRTRARDPRRRAAPLHGARAARDRTRGPHRARRRAPRSVRGRSPASGAARQCPPSTRASSSRRRSSSRSPSCRRCAASFATPGPYLAVALASLVMVPVLLWNAQHDWASFRFQLAHGLTPVRGSGDRARGRRSSPASSAS